MNNTRKRRRNNHMQDPGKVDTIDMNQHVQGQNPNKSKKKRKCGLYITGFHCDLTQDVILNYFGKYGTIIWVNFTQSSILIKYSEPLAVENVMKSVHYLRGKRLTIKQRKIKTQENGEDFIEHEDLHLIKKLIDIPRFDDQVGRLIENLQPNRNEQFPKYRKICEDIYNILCYFAYPRCKVYPFGSTVTGLYFEKSDVDVFIAGIKKQDNDKKYLYKLRNFLLNSSLFSDVIVIARAKIPILKCVHVETGIKCDINCKNMLGVCNSELINYYLNIDPKVKNLMLVLKYWAKVHKITGQNHFFSNYSICMMLIFYLQHEPYNLPSVLSLQHNSYYDRLHDGWNGGFEKIYVDTAYLVDTSLLKLMRGFFAFYAAFEYGINIICPYLGKAVRKDEFKNPKTLPNYFSSYKRCAEDGILLKVDTTICIQDPFEHTRNTTPIVPDCTLNTFVSFCRLGVVLCDENENNSSILYNILTANPSSILKTNSLSCNSEIKESEFIQFSVPMRACLKYIEEKIEECSNRQGAIQEAWFKSVVEFTTIVLKDFLKFDVTELNESAAKPKNNKCEGHLDVHGNEKNQVSYRCVGKMNLWEGRKSAKKRSVVDPKIKHGIIDREVAITDQLYNPYKDFPQRPDIIGFKITLEHKSTPPEMVVNVYKTTAYKNTFKSFAAFFSANLPSWFEVYEKEQNLQRT